MNEDTLQVILKQIAEMKASVLTEKKLMALTKKSVLDTADVALLFNRSIRTIHTWRKNNEIVAKRINGRYFYTWDSITDLLNSKNL